MASIGESSQPEERWTYVNAQLEEYEINSDEHVESEVQHDSDEQDDSDERSEEEEDEMFDMFTGKPVSYEADDRLSSMREDEEDSNLDLSVFTQDYHASAISISAEASDKPSRRSLKTESQSASATTHVGEAQEEQDIRALNANAHLPFQHEPLTDSSLIRVLDILPAESPGEILQCSMKTCLPTRVYYLAISYTWGQTYADGSHLTHSIPCDGKLLRITSSLHTALMAVRDHLDAGRWTMFGRRPCVWVDAACIDQESIQERSHQVQMMAQIYSKATEVIIWLGEAALGQDDALARTAMGTFLQNPARNDSSDATVHEFTSEDMTELLRRPWFQRRWVVQEFAIPKTRTILFGKAAIDFNRFFAVVTRFGLAHHAGPMSYVPLLDSFRPKKWLLANLHCFSEAKCSLPHDIVFALISISCGCKFAWARSRCGALDCGSKNYTVDYSTPIPDLFISIAREAMRLDPMAVLAAACVRLRQKPRPYVQPDIPSWAPDWRVLPGNCSLDFRSYVDLCFKAIEYASPDPAYDPPGETFLLLRDRREWEFSIKVVRIPEGETRNIVVQGWIVHQPRPKTRVSEIEWVNKPIPEGMVSSSPHYDPLTSGPFLKRPPKYRDPSPDSNQGSYQTVCGEWPDVDPSHVICLLPGYQLMLVLEYAGSGQYSLINCFRRTASIRRLHFVWTQSRTGYVWAYGDVTRPFVEINIV